jgi:hypothetical protein
MHALLPIVLSVDIAGYADLDGGLWAMGRSLGSAQCYSAPPAADPTGAAGSGGSCPAQHDQATSTADLPGRRP